MYPWTFMLFSILNAVLTHGVSKYYEGENRPYEFGFNLDGHQHRHESKDENGIIMGEFGFITADGVYHVTAYATDENGNFKILFMKNIKIGLPGNQSSSTLALPKKPPSKQKDMNLTPITVHETNKLRVSPLQPGNTQTCSGCAIPKERLHRDPNVVNLQENNIINLNKMRKINLNEKSKIKANSRKIQESFTEMKGDSPESQPRQMPNRRRLNSTKTIDRNLLRIQDNESPGDKYPKTTFAKQNERNMNQIQDKLNESSGGKYRKTNTASEDNLSKPPGDRNRNIPNDPMFSDQMRNALVGLLYKFNYTVGFHGHHEKGDFVGSKDGGFYFVGRDGLRREVNYVANEYGYQPYLLQEQARKEDVPKVETEKNTGLKGYEFKWFIEKESN